MIQLIRSHQMCIPALWCSNTALRRVLPVRYTDLLMTGQVCLNCCYLWRPHISITIVPSGIYSRSELIFLSLPVYLTCQQTCDFNFNSLIHVVHTNALLGCNIPLEVPCNIFKAKTMPHKLLIYKLVQNVYDSLVKHVEMLK